MKYVLWIFLAGMAFSQVTPTQIRSVTSLPATCKPGNGSTPTDMVAFISGGLTFLEGCTTTNSWSVLATAPSLSCNASNQGLQWNGSTLTCATFGGTPGTPNGAIQSGQSGAFVGDSTFTFTPSTHTETVENLLVTGVAQYAGAYQVIGSTNPSSALACPAVGFTNFGVNNDHYIAECIGGMATSEDLTYIANNISAGLTIATQTGANPGLVEVPNSVDLATAYGSTDLCVSIAAGKTAHLTDGVTLDGRSFGAQGANIVCSVNTYVSGYAGQILLPAGTINVQPSGFSLQAQSDVTGQGVDATQFLACVSPNANCGGNYWPTASVATSPIVYWTDDGIGPNFNTHPIFDSTLNNSSINCAGGSGLIGLANYVAQENSGPYRVAIHNCFNHGNGYSWGGADQSKNVTPSQTGSAASTSSSTACTNCSIPAMATANVAGDTIVACGLWKPGSSSINTVTDTANNQYTVIASSLQADGAFTMECAYAQGINAAAIGNVIRFNFLSATAAFDVLMAVEYAHINGINAALDQVAVTITTTGSPTCPAITPIANTTGNGAFVMCAVQAEASGATYAVGTTSGCSVGCNLSVGTSLQGAEWIFQSTPAAVTLNWVSPTTRRAILVSMDYLVALPNGPGSQNHTVYKMNIYGANGETITTDSHLVVGNPGAIGIAGPKSFNDVTSTINNGAIGTMLELARICGTGTTFNNWHVENWAGTNSYGVGLGEDCGFVDLIFNNLNSGQAASGTALLFMSSAGASNSIIIHGLNAAGPNYPTDLMIDQINGFTDLTANESKISEYITSINGCRFSGSGSGQCVQTTSAFFPVTMGLVDFDLFQTTYSAVCKYGDCQAGAASQYVATSLFTSMPVGFTQIVVSTKAVTSVNTHPQIQDDATIGTAMGVTCNTSQSFTYRVLAKQGWNSSAPFLPATYAPYTVSLPISSTSFTSNTVTHLMASTTGLAVGDIIRTSNSSVSTGGPFGTGYNTLGWITAVTPNVSISYSLTYGSAITACSSTCGTVNIVEGLVIGASTAPVTNPACLSLTNFF